jgi:hypothetical protein
LLSVLINDPESHLVTLFNCNEPLKRSSLHPPDNPYTRVIYTYQPDQDSIHSLVLKDFSVGQCTGNEHVSWCKSIAKEFKKIVFVSEYAMFLQFAY